MVREFVAHLQRRSSQQTATLDLDARIVESDKREARWTYAGVKGYQPTVVVWAEQDVVVADEFRDGNVPAQSGMLRVLTRAVESLPEGVEDGQWHAHPEDPCVQWAEVPFVPSEPYERKDSEPNRYLGIRVRPRQRELFSDGSRVKHFGVVTNDWECDGGALITWQRKKAGTVEHVHHLVKNELGARVVPCSRFHANAAWF